MLGIHFAYISCCYVWQTSDKLSVCQEQPLLKPHVHHQREYGMGTRGVMLIPVTPPTRYVAEWAKRGFSGQANTAWGPSAKLSPIQNGRPSYIGAYVRTKCTSQNLSRARNMVLAYRGCLTNKPITACYLVLPDARTQISLRNALRTAFACRHLRLKYVYRYVKRVSL